MAPDGHSGQTTDHEGMEIMSIPILLELPEELYERVWAARKPRFDKSVPEIIIRAVRRGLDVRTPESDFLDRVQFIDDGQVVNR